MKESTTKRIEDVAVTLFCCALMFKCTMLGFDILDHVKLYPELWKQVARFILGWVLVIFPSLYYTALGMVFSRWLKKQF